VHSLVIGPGLGRDPTVITVASEVVKLCSKHKVPVVIDADGLWMVNLHLDVIRQVGLEKGNLILTPNLAEFDRLYDATLASRFGASLEEDVSSIKESTDDATPLKKQKKMSGENEPFSFAIESQQLAAKLELVCSALGGITVLVKGEIDMVIY
jgi:NAD(P)H-hydrate repair Nnr-like enzyme with NAD(P)H-hydrate dehydratase domain